MHRAKPTSLALAAMLGSLLAPTAWLAAQSPQQTVISVAVTATTSPPALSFTWPLDPSAVNYTVMRRLPGATTWGPSTLVPGAGAAISWTDTQVAVGTRYEYYIYKNANPPARTFVTGGVEAAAIESRGSLILLVDSTKATALGARLDRLIEDLVGDGWTILRHDVAPTATVVSVKALILADVANHPGQVKQVFLLGRLAVPYSGSIAPDGHGDHSGAWPADLFYGELNGVWTDTSVNNNTASRAENRNVPGDGKYDQSSIPSDIDLGVGRVDFANMPSFALSETALLQQYLDKDHDYRHKVFTADQLAVVDDNFGYFGGEAFAASGWRNFCVLVGPNNSIAADYFTTLNTTSGNGYVWSYGCGGGWYQGAGGVGSTTDFTTSTNRSVFTMLFGSYFGDWDATDSFLRAPLCSGWTLSNVWAGRPHWSFHPMGLGDTLGACARYSQNDTSAGGYGTRSVHVALMGDPTLRQHVVAPPTGVAVVDQWPQANVTWTASADSVAGYHVYRAASPEGPFTRLTSQPVGNTVFTDPAALSGPSTYLVRALRLETVPSGSYWNLSQGAFATQVLPQQSASHTRYGTGCYTISDSFYQYFATPAAASTALLGRSITLSPANGGYTVTDGGGNFVAPCGAATALTLGDDTQVAIATSTPFSYPGGTTSTLYVHSNGILGAAPISLSAAASALPGPANFLNELSAAWYCWHDFDPSEVGSGNVVAEEVGGTLCVTWLGVESRPAGVANPSTLQFQFELATGIVRMVWPSLTNVGTGQPTAPSEQFLVGWSPGGPSTDAGSVDLAAVLPLSIGNANLEPLQLNASPAPVVTPTTGAMVTFTLDHVPAWTPGNHLAFTVISLVPDLTGTSLATMGMPGCTQYLGTLDLFLLGIGSGPTLSVTLSLPPGLAGGTMVYAQALALVAPNSLPNGQNPFGAITSNGIASFVNDH